MESKDTVIKINEKNRRNTLQEKLLEQAEISFPLGRKEGIEEVVDYLVKHGEGVYPNRKGQYMRLFGIEQDEWQAKLKEWEITQ